VVLHVYGVCWLTGLYVILEQFRQDITCQGGITSGISFCQFFSGWLNKEDNHDMLLIIATGPDRFAGKIE
jgi:hypothetical protein